MSSGVISLILGLLVFVVINLGIKLRNLEKGFDNIEESYNYYKVRTERHSIDIINMDYEIKRLTARITWLEDKKGDQNEI